MVIVQFHGRLVRQDRQVSRISRETHALEYDHDLTLTRTEDMISHIFGSEVLVRA